jgi:hypothetical protein
MLAGSVMLVTSELSALTFVTGMVATTVPLPIFACKLLKIQKTIRKYLNP